MENWKEIESQIASRENLTSYDEPQACLDLPNDCSLVVTHEEFGLSDAEQYYSWRVHCSEEDFENNKYYSTCGIVAQSVSKDLKEETCKEKIAWAIMEAEKTRTEQEVSLTNLETTISLNEEEIKSLSDATGIAITDSDTLKAAISQVLTMYKESLNKEQNKVSRGRAKK